MVGGLSPSQLKYQAYLRSPGWRARRNAKLVEVGHRCEVCGVTSGLEVHHLSYERRGRELMSDLRVLCPEHHADAHNEQPLIASKPTWRDTLSDVGEYAFFIVLFAGVVAFWAMCGYMMIAVLSGPLGLPLWLAIGLVISTLVYVATLVALGMRRQRRANAVD